MTIVQERKEEMKEKEKRKTFNKRVVLNGLCLALIGCIAASSVFPSYGVQNEDSSTLLMASMGVISADASGNYHLSDTVSRGEFAKMLALVSPYKEMVASGVYSSPFKDVAASHLMAPYIRIVATNGLLSGYSDGTFRPDSNVTLEQAANSALKLLGYSQSDFQGAFPYAQMNTYVAIGLSKNIAGGIGTVLTRQSAVNLLYNLMGATMKDGTQKYAQTLGYSMNSSGEVDYADVVTSNMNGPYTVQSTSWTNDLGVNSSAVVYKNGTLANISDVSLYDVVYYSKDKGTIWVYSDRITGIYEKADPSQNAVTSVTISGKVYAIESSAAFAALSSTGTLKIGDAVTLLLGKSGGVADAVSAETINETTAIYVTETGAKTYEDGSGNHYTSKYIKGVTPSGNEIEYTVSVNWIQVGDTVTVTFSGDTMRVSSASSSLSGKADHSLMTIGNQTVSSGVSILDTYEGAYKATSMSRISGMTLDRSDILYYKAENGKITELILDNVTGDALQYGVVISAQQSGSNLNISGSYSYDLDGATKTLSTQSSALNVKVGAAAFYGPGNQISNIKNLMSVGTKVTSVTNSYVIANGVAYEYSPDVKVYQKDGNSYKLTTISAAVAAGKSASFYYDFDKTVSAGARIRVIIIPK